MTGVEGLPLPRLVECNARCEYGQWIDAEESCVGRCYILAEHPGYADAPRIAVTPGRHRVTAADVFTLSVRAACLLILAVAAVYAVREARACHRRGVVRVRGRL